MVRGSLTDSFLVVGDIHRFWSEEDVAFLDSAGAGHVLFVGDLGDEDVEMAQAVA